MLSKCTWLFHKCLTFWNKFALIHVHTLLNNLLLIVCFLNEVSVSVLDGEVLVSVSVPDGEVSVSDGEVSVSVSVSVSGFQVLNTTLQKSRNKQVGESC